MGKDDEARSSPCSAPVHPDECSARHVPSVSSNDSDMDSSTNATLSVVETFAVFDAAHDSSIVPIVSRIYQQRLLSAQRQDNEYREQSARTRLQRCVLA